RLHYLVKRHMRLTAVLLVFLLSPSPAASPAYFEPMHRISGIGTGREDLSGDVLELRTDRMIQSQTFSIMRDPMPLARSKRITGPKLQTSSQSAAVRSGIPASLLEAMAFEESWGVANAESPAGPKGIMQVSAATARSIGLAIVTGTRYKVTRERVAVP